MTMFLIQALLWLLVAFLLGYGIARFLKSLFCRDGVDADVYAGSIATPKVDTGRAGTGGSGVSGATATVLGGAAAAAAGAVAVARDKLDDIDLPDVSLKTSKVDVDLPEVSMAAPEMDVALLDMPGIDVGLPEVSLSAPTVGAGLSDVEVTASAMDLSGIDPHKPIIDPPDLDIGLPEVSMAVPEMDAGLPDVEMDGQLPAMEVETPAVTLEEGNGLLDLAKGAVVAAGAGLAATAVSAEDELVLDDEVIDDETDWLHVLVQRVKDEYQGHNPRAVSKLWSVDSGYDCSAIDQYDSLSLQPAQYDKLGSSHCGVPRAGFVAVGGDVSNVEQATAVLFHYCNIVVCRDADDNHHFIRVTG